MRNNHRKSCNMADIDSRLFLSCNALKGSYVTPLDTPSSLHPGSCSSASLVVEKAIYMRPTAILDMGYHLLWVRNNGDWDGTRYRKEQIQESVNVNSVRLGDGLNKGNKGTEEGSQISSTIRTWLLLLERGKFPSTLLGSFGWSNN